MSHKTFNYLSGIKCAIDSGVCSLEQIETLVLVGSYPGAPVEILTEKYVRNITVDEFTKLAQGFYFEGGKPVPNPLLVRSNDGTSWRLTNRGITLLLSICPWIAHENMKSR